MVRVYPVRWSVHGSLQDGFTLPHWLRRRPGRGRGAGGEAGEEPVPLRCEGDVPGLPVHRQQPLGGRPILLHLARVASDRYQQ